MKRTPLKRKTPLRAKSPMRRGGGRLRPRSLKGQRAQRRRPWAYMGWVRELPCAAADKTCAGRVEAAHTGPRGLGRKSSDWQVIPLCGWHHRMGPAALDRIGPRQFEAAHGFGIRDLVARLNRCWELATGNEIHHVDIGTGDRSAADDAC